MKISVIIPVYNCEDKIKRCVDSILAQGIKELEIILVMMEVLIIQLRFVIK